MRLLLIAAILTGCSGLSDEEFYGPDELASCWTVDGDSSLFYYLPIGYVMSDEFKKECEQLRRNAK